MRLEPFLSPDPELYHRSSVFKIDISISSYAIHRKRKIPTHHVFVILIRREFHIKIAISCIRFTIRCRVEGEELLVARNLLFTFAVSKPSHVRTCSVIGQSIHSVSARIRRLRGRCILGVVSRDLNAYLVSLRPIHFQSVERGFRVNIVDAGGEPHAFRTRCKHLIFRTVRKTHHASEHTTC